MLLWFWYCKWRILADISFATSYERYEINSVNKVYRTMVIFFKQRLKCFRPSLVRDDIDTVCDDLYLCLCT